MTNPREILNNIKWNPELNIKETEIWYIHRGAPDDTKIISGKEIIDIGKSFIETTTATIPYHRIFKISYGEKILFER